jgi:hypothetical protein
LARPDLRPHRRASRGPPRYGQSFRAMCADSGFAAGPLQFAASGAGSRGRRQDRRSNGLGCRRDGGEWPYRRPGPGMSSEPACQSRHPHQLDPASNPRGPAEPGGKRRLEMAEESRSSEACRPEELEGLSGLLPARRSPAAKPDAPSPGIFRAEPSGARASHDEA